MSDYVTGAELQMLREACHLTRDDLAELCGVQTRTIKHWEQRNGGVPADVAAMLAAIDAQVQAVAEQAAQQVRQLVQQQGEAPEDVLMVRYTTNADLRRYQPDMGPLPANAHAAMLARLRWMVAPWRVRVVRFDAAGYEAWRKELGRPDDAATRMEWAAAVALPDQAKPHRGDQPPV